ncbi:MAG: hypothetical protein ACTSQA_00360 [Candidatus Heimdallarchaeaceae archaeon]
MGLISDLKEVRYKIIDLRLRDFKDSKIINELAKLKSVINDTFNLIKTNKVPMNL